VRSPLVAVQPWPMPAAAALLITPDDLAELHRWARSAQLPAVLVQRARILLLAADGAANTEIAQRVGVSRPTVIACRRRYVRRGLEGLPDRPRPGRPTVRRFRRAEILSATLNPPPARLGITHWSTRLLPANSLSAAIPSPASGASTASSPGALGPSSPPPTPNWPPRSTTLSGSTCTHPIARWCCASMRRPRSKPWNALSPCAASGREAWSAAPTTTSDMALPPCSLRWSRDRPRHQPMRCPPPPPGVPRVPQAARPNLSTPAAASGLRQLRHPQAPHGPRLARPPPPHPAAFTPTSASWLNLVEVFFSIVERQALRRGDFASVTDRIAAISRFCAAWNQRCQRFSWTKSADEILTKLNRQTTSATQH
jgi:hypothetical protein